MPDDGANGYEECAEIFMRARNPKIGLSVMRRWASQLAPGSRLLELGCGHGVVSQVLLETGVKLSVVAWGLIFLLAETDQRLVLRRAADALRPNGRLIFTAPNEAVAWKDSITEMPSLSLGATVYEAFLQDL